MDKNLPYQKIHSQRSGFALLITLSVLSVIIALTVVLLGYFDEVKEDSDTTKALIQADVYYADILEVFEKVKDKKALFNILYRVPVFLQSPDKRFSLSLKCEPLAKGININWLGFEEDKKRHYLYEEAQRIFDILVQQYGVEDPDRLLEMLTLEIGGSSTFVVREQSRLRQKNGIISYEQFSDIVSRYQLEADDSHVGHIPWRKYFSFSDKAQKIDAEYSSAELISLLFDIDLATVNEWHNAAEKSSLAVFVEENGLNYAQKKPLLAEETFLGQSMCSVRYGDGYHFSFRYIDGGAKHFEFYGKH
ncbi:hypothetical protein MNB_SV-3-173 [hydrothermal vent metagenome]|uniref:General secretion pathway protein K n=1 Tax=hydrothermal vent metagenome TaxID=652676 RepID=A0A1W1BS10_9ZZZZ